MKHLIYIITVVLFCLPAKGENVIKENKDIISVEADSQAKQEVKKVKMIFDTDLGIDDAMALAYAVGSPNIDLIGVTLVYGNVSTETSGRNTLDLLTLLHREDIPVYAGATHSYSTTEVFLPAKGIKRIHGNNGIGDVQIRKSAKSIEKQNAVDFMIESAKKYGKELVIVAVGAMTNLQDAVKKEPKLKDMVGEIVIMGGALTVPGNVSKLAEANIYQDPVATNELFTSGTPITMVGLDVTNRVRLNRDDTQKWRDLGTEAGKAFADIVDFYINATSSAQLQGCALHDPLAVAVAVYPDLVQTFSMFMTVGTSQDDWGRTVGDKKRLNDPDPNIKACINVDRERFVADFNKVLTDLFRKTK